MCCWGPDVSSAVRIYVGLKIVCTSSKRGSLENVFSSITGLTSTVTGSLADSDTGFFPSVAADTLDFPSTQEQTQKQLLHVKIINTKPDLYTG